ncbi:MAG: DUF5071 domain-containing protein [Lysinibacillus sp.]
MEREKIVALTQAPVAEVVAHFPQLISALKDESLQQSILAMIKQYPTESTPHIEEALLSEDDELKRIILEQVVATLPFYSKMVVASVVEQIAMSSGDLQQVAKEVLQSFEP